ncbi:MAG TPA: trigger factor [Desulfatirhabdiaceae bacterium]|nr:trigger factor [Desulfatirhabdiaceae bacterium]
MSYTIEDVSPVKKLVQFEIPRDEVVKRLDKAYSDMKSKAKVKGFRPGKTPRNVLERLYGKDIQQDIISEFMQTSYADFLKDSGLTVMAFHPQGEPNISADSPFQFKGTIEIRPQIADLSWKELQLTKNRYKPSEEEIDVQLKLGQRNLAVMKPISEDRPVQNGDYVIMDYEATKDGNPAEEIGKSENFTCKIGVASISQEMDAAMIGMVPGERRSIPIKFPEDHPHKPYAGLDVVFNVYLREIREQILPEIDDDLAKKLGPYQSLEELKTTIRQDLEQHYNHRADQEINERIFQKLFDQAEFEVPDTMIQYELSGIIQDVERRFEYNNLSLADRGLDHSILANQYRDLAEKQARRHLILEKIVAQEGLTVQDSELETVYSETAAASGQTVDVVRDIYTKNPETMSYLRMGLLEKKAMRLIIDHSIITEVDPVLTHPETTEAKNLDSEQ